MPPVARLRSTWRWEGETPWNRCGQGSAGRATSAGATRVRARSCTPWPATPPARTGFRVCAIEVVRPKGLLEFVAIHGDPVSAEDRLGTASRLSDMQLVFAQGEEHGHFLWIPFENLSEEIRERIDGVIVVPDIPTTGEQGDWHPMDMLVARIDDERGDLRALLYLDVPQRPRTTRRRTTPRHQRRARHDPALDPHGRRARGVRRPHAGHPGHPPARAVQPRPPRRQPPAARGPLDPARGAVRRRAGDPGLHRPGHRHPRQPGPQDGARGAASPRRGRGACVDPPAGAHHRARARLGRPRARGVRRLVHRPRSTRPASRPSSSLPSAWTTRCSAC